MIIQEIIKYLDKHMVENDLNSLSAVEAGQQLDNTGLLKDSQSRPGLPLRKLLRAGKIPHAYQTAGKGSSWVIPISGHLIPNMVSFEKKKETSDTRQSCIKLDFFVRGWPGRVFAAIPLDRSRVANTTGLSTLLFIAHRVSLPDDLLSINPGSRVVPEETCHIW